MSTPCGPPAISSSIAPNAVSTSPVAEVARLPRPTAAVGTRASSATLGVGSVTIGTTPPGPPVVWIQVFREAWSFASSYLYAAISVRGMQPPPTLAAPENPITGSFVLLLLEPSQSSFEARGLKHASYSPLGMAYRRRGLIVVARN